MTRTSYKSIDNITFIDVKQKEALKKPINKMILIGAIVAILLAVVGLGVGLGVGLSTNSQDSSLLAISS